MKNGKTKRRVAFSLLLVVAIVSVFVIRLVDIQVVRAASYNEASEGKMSIPEKVLGVRGDIVDISGKVLATARMTYDVTVSPRNAKEFTRTTDTGDVKISSQQAAQEIAAITKQKPDEIIGIINDALAKDPKADFAYLTRGVDIDAYRAISALDIPWIYFEQNPSRSYPNGAVAGNLLGYVGADGVPLAGLELLADECLAATDGTQSYARGADGVRIPGSTVVSRTAKNGGTLKLTIDSDLQWFTQQALSSLAASTSSRWGMAVVIDVKTGQLAAVADYPTLDPNNIDGSNPADRGSRAFADPYEPGSTMKTLTAASLVDAGLADPSTEVDSPYSIQFPNGAQFKDWGRHPRNLTLEGVLTLSSNTGIAQLGERMNPEARYDYLGKFGVGQETAVGFPGESAGYLPSWEQWDNQSYYTMLFGQGLTLTAIQMASAYATIGNGGVHEPVSLVQDCTSSVGAVNLHRKADPIAAISPSAARTTLDMMENVVNQGWLRDAGLSVPGYRIAAKTGTAEQSDGNGSYSDKYIVSLATIFPADHPEYAIVMSLNAPDVNSNSPIVPVMGQVIKQIIKAKQIQPSTGEPPAYPLYY